MIKIRVHNTGCKLMSNSLYSDIFDYLLKNHKRKNPPAMISSKAAAPADNAMIPLVSSYQCFVFSGVTGGRVVVLLGDEVVLGVVGVVVVSRVTVVRGPEVVA